MKYIDVILPLPLKQHFTYCVPDEMDTEVHVGMRVVVPFGKSKMYTAIVYLIHSLKPELPYEIKPIVSLLDTKSVVRFPQLKFWEWISAYYMSTLGDVYQAAIPAGLKLESETLISIQPEFESEVRLSDKEQMVLDALSEGKPMAVNELIKLTGIVNILPVVKLLHEKNAVVVNESLSEKYRAKTEICVRLHPEFDGEKELNELFNIVSKKEKQLKLIMQYIDLSKYLQAGNRREVTKKELLDKSGISNAVLSTLIDKNIFESYKREISRLAVQQHSLNDIFTLNEAQQEAFTQINKSFQTNQVVLLHGVTSSGKTEIYIHLIKQIIEKGQQVLFLVPEIALTTQLTSRLQRVFGNKLGVYHSKFSDAERVEIWNNVLNDTGYDVVIGVRSSIFLPFRKLGLIIVDEEHESSYKQYDPAPRYHARNAAIVLASMHGAKTLLGSATPSIESFSNTKNGKYALVTLDKRHEDIQLPDIMVVDTKDAYHRKQMNGFFSDVLLQKIEKALSQKEQVILFQNRRGYAPFVECKQCALVPTCKHCDVSLTVHKVFNTLTCHYCGYTEPIPALCPACKTPSLSTKGFGTEKIEDEISQLFPDARVSRMDYDTTRNKHAYQKMITEFEQHKVDILIGTQMVTKGLDFEHVSVVGILNADTMLNFPDYRAHERAFQLMVQVSGRAGRKYKRGLVILQTSNPKHPVIEQVVNNDYATLYDVQTSERSQFKYPPYYRIVEITLRHKMPDVVKKAGFELANRLRQVFGARILGPVDPPVSRIQNMYIKQILMKVELDANVGKAKDIVTEVSDLLLAESKFKSVRIAFDVDPV